MKEILILFVGEYRNSDLTGEETAADVIYFGLGSENAKKISSYDMVALTRSPWAICCTWHSVILPLKVFRMRKCLLSFYQAWPG
jgi:hypothetical protein